MPRGGKRVAGPGKRLGAPSGPRKHPDDLRSVYVGVRLTEAEAQRVEATGLPARDVLLAGVEAVTPTASRS